MSRFVELLFGNPFHTPSKDEQAMFFAFSAALRSASLARQVGAVITREDGSIIAVGTNEVPKAGGGQYWENDDPDGRDFRGAYDSSDRMRQNLLADILQRLEQASWLREEHSAKPIVQLVDEALYQEQPGKNLSLMKGAQFMSTIDFVRAVHAEMSAITNAARHGVGTQGCILYTTTFPCHDCAKHIVAAGIRRVVYVEPYPKSLVQELYGDSVAVDASDSWGKRVSFDPFVGVASKRYTELFRASIARKDERGMVAVWQRSNAKPNLPSYLPSAAVSLFSETSDFESFMNSMRDKDLAPTNEESDDA
jgi:cytidine deaminase